MQREHTGPEHLSELLGTLNKLSSGEEEDQTQKPEVLRESIEALARAGELRETSASGHGDLVARYSQLIARALALSAEEMDDICFAARVHDVGKIFVPDRILNKNGPLTDDEFYLVKLHPHVGAEILATIPKSEDLQKAVGHHHEAFDGTGYPDSLRGEQIPLWARILAVADSYVNMTTDRPFAAPKSSEQALTELERLSGTRYDGMLVRVLARELKNERAASSLGSEKS